MDDLISRKAAIDAIMDADVCVTWNGVISDDDAVDIAIKSTKGSVISSIVNLPSAQPVAKDTNVPINVNDCISRQYAIRIVDGIDTWQAGWRGNAIESIKALPSEQPEIVACGDCKHWICHDRRCGYWNHGVRAIDWCSHAERRTDGD